MKTQKEWSLDEIYNGAIDKGFLSRELRMKDEAMDQTGILMKILNPNIEIDEDSILDFSKKHDLKYDSSGNLKGYFLETLNEMCG